MHNTLIISDMYTLPTLENGEELVAHRLSKLTVNKTLLSSHLITTKLNCPTARLTLQVWSFAQLSDEAAAPVWLRALLVFCSVVFAGQ
eukprot:829336-Prorocentrum_minimum.AAC.2